MLVDFKVRKNFYSGNYRRGEGRRKLNNVSHDTVHPVAYKQRLLFWLKVHIRGIRLSGVVENGIQNFYYRSVFGTFFFIKTSTLRLFDILGDYRRKVFYERRFI